MQENQKQLSQRIRKKNVSQTNNLPRKRRKNFLWTTVSDLLYIHTIMGCEWIEDRTNGNTER